MLHASRDSGGRLLRCMCQGKRSEHELSLLPFVEEQQRRRRCCSHATAARCRGRSFRLVAIAVNDEGPTLSDESSVSCSAARWRRPPNRADQGLLRSAATPDSRNNRKLEMGSRPDLPRVAGAPTRKEVGRAQHPCLVQARPTFSIGGRRPFHAGPGRMYLPDPVSRRLGRCRSSRPSTSQRSSPWGFAAVLLIRARRQRYSFEGSGTGQPPGKSSMLECTVSWACESLRCFRQ
jgi:hypothetical protein